MIMLPLHGQGTAAVEKSFHWAGWTCYMFNRRCFC